MLKSTRVPDFLRGMYRSTQCVGAERRMLVLLQEVVPARVCWEEQGPVCTVDLSELHL